MRTIWCGPAAVQLATGIPYDTFTAWCKEHRKSKREIKGVYVNEISTFLRKQGFTVVVTPYIYCVRLKTLLLPNTNFIALSRSPISHHFTFWNGIALCDSQNPFGHIPLEKHSCYNRKVTHTITITA